MADIFHIYNPSLFEGDLHDFGFGLCDAPKTRLIDLEHQPGVFLTVPSILHLSHAISPKLKQANWMTFVTRSEHVCRMDAHSV